MKDICFIGVDIGHTNCKAIAVTPAGKVFAKSGELIPIISEETGQYEQEPEIVWRAVVETTATVVRELRRRGNVEISALSIGSYRGALMLLDSTGAPLTNILTRLDSRDAECVQKFTQYYNNRGVYDITGQPCENYTLAKLMWLKENAAEVFDKRSKLFTSPKEYILWRIMGEHITNESMAQSTLMYNQYSMRWDADLMRYGEVVPGSLPNVLDMLMPIGKTGEYFESLTGVPASTPLILGACDGVNSNLGVGAVRKGAAAVSLGSFVAVRCISDRMLSTGFKFDRKMLPSLGVMTTVIRKNGGRILNWIQDVMAHGMKMGDLDALSEKLPKGWSGLISVPNFNGPVLSCGREEDLPIILGLRESDSVGSIMKSIYEGISFGIKSYVQTFESDSFKINELFIGGGGAKSKVWPQIISDITGISGTLPKETEASAIGAAICAAVGSGYFDRIDLAVNCMVVTAGRVLPHETINSEYERIYELTKELNSSSEMFYARVSELRRAET